MWIDVDRMWIDISLDLEYNYPPEFDYNFHKPAIPV